MAKFNLAAALAAAEAGDASQWEGIARHLIAKQPKPRKAKSVGPQTWAHVVLQDGREYLTSAYAKADTAKTLAAHGEYAQFRARMEDSGDRDKLGGDRKTRWCAYERGVTLDRSIAPVPVKLVTILEDGDAVERARERCFEQRGKRQGWWSAYQHQQRQQTAA